MTFVHIGQVTQMKKGRGFYIWCMDINHTLEEKEAEIIRSNVVRLCKEFHHNVIDVKEHNKKGTELIH